MTQDEEARILLGKRLASWRRGLGDVAQRDIARHAGTRQPTLSQYESGKRDAPFHIVERYADYLHVSIDLMTSKTYEEAVADGTAPRAQVSA